MKSDMQQLLAIGALVAGAEANLLSWPRDDASWFPAKETGAAVKYAPAVAAAAAAAKPVPTSPAVQFRGDDLAKGQANGLGLAKRADDVCGYVSGDPSKYQCPL